MGSFPVSPEVVVVVAILPANLADVDGPGQPRVVLLLLSVQNVGGDLAVGSQPEIIIRD